jgi:hypothetical protein
MLLFKPVVLNARLLKEMVPAGGAVEVEFWLVNDPLVSLNRGHLVEYPDLAQLIHSSIELQTVPNNGNSFPVPTLAIVPQIDSKATENSKDDEGRYAKCA